MGLASNILPGKMLPWLFWLLPAVQLPGQQAATDAVLLQYKDQLEDAQAAADPLLIAQKHRQLGAYFEASGVFTEAVEQYTRAIEALKARPNDTLLILLKNNIGQVHLALNNFDLAAQHFREGLADAQPPGQFVFQAQNRSGAAFLLFPSAMPPRPGSRASGGRRHHAGGRGVRSVWVTPLPADINPTSPGVTTLRAPVLSRCSICPSSR